MENAEKAEGEEQEKVPKKIIDDGPETDAELKLKEETEKAKKELIDQIKNFKPEDDENEAAEED